MTYITYNFDDINALTSILTDIQISGVKDIRGMAKAFDIIESGKLSKDTDIGLMSVEHGDPKAENNKTK